MAVEKKIKYKDQRLTKAQQKKAKAVKQAGIKNFLGKQKTVTVPKKWLSSSDHVVAELAYITPKEQKILLDADLYGSLNGQPNRGPGGIMSLQGAGDGGGSENAGTDDKGNSMGGGTGPSVQAPPGVRSNPTAPTDGTKGTLSDPREKFDFVGNTKYGPTQKYTGGGFFSGANKYGYREVDTNPFSKNFGETKPGYGGRIMGGLLSLATGIPFVGGAIGSMYDKGKGLFGSKTKDMSQFNNLGLYTDRLTDPNYNYDGDFNDGVEDIFEDDVKPKTIFDDGGGDGQDNNLTTSSLYQAPTVTETGEVTSGGNILDFLQRFKVKEPYRMAKGNDYIAEDKAIAEQMKNFYT
mgnify:FL=1